jgi:HAD superfamily 5'-nucleotidase-like hydrolase
MDYTLALYNQGALDALSVEKTLERLVSERGYPEQITSIRSDPDFAIRGLVIDKEHGNILKVDGGRRVTKAFHGFTAIEDLERHDYGVEGIRKGGGRFHLIDTLFALPEAFLYAALIDFFESRDGGVPVSYYQVFEDIRYCIDLAHRDRSLKDEIMADMGEFIVRDDRLASTLHKFRSTGKKLFLMTNSGHEYTEAVMSYLLNGRLREYPSWRNYFDITVTAASKPIFFTGRRPFLALDNRGKITGQADGSLGRDVIYQGGNLKDFESWTGWASGRIVYIGDHIYGDILKSKKISAWKTVMIVQEMMDELRRPETYRDQITRVRELEEELQRTSQELVYESHMSHQVQRALSDSEEGVDEVTTKELKRAYSELRRSTDALKKERKRVVRRLVELDREIEANFNPYWGLIFKAGNEHSIFASQVALYADLYTSAVSNFLNYSPNQYFRAPRAVMPHEL